jgi:GTP-binding protein HflX
LETEAQKADVLKVLSELGVEPSSGAHPGEARHEQNYRTFVEVLNKIDLMEAGARESMLERSSRDDAPIAISAKTGEGLDVLLRRFEAQLVSANIHFHLALDASDGEGLAWVYRHGHVLDRHSNGDTTIELDVSATTTELEKFEHRFGEKMMLGQGVEDDS